MATNFYFKTGGVVGLRVRVYGLVNGKSVEIINQKKTIKGLSIEEGDWIRFNELERESAKSKFLANNPDFKFSYEKLMKIKSLIDEAGLDITKEMTDEIIHSVIFAEQIEAAEKKAAAKEARKAAKAEAKRKAEAMTLTKFIDAYIAEIKEGTKTTLQYGRSYATGSRHNVANSLGHFKEFMKETGVEYDFQDVDLDCYTKYKNWLMKRDISVVGFKNTFRDYNKSAKLISQRTSEDDGNGEGTENQQKTTKKEKQTRHYSDNTVGRFIKQLKAVLRAADSRGYPVNPAYKNIEFKGQVSEIDSIYLTRAELEAMENVDLKDIEDGRNLELARDLFMIGVWTAQRVSDYNNIGPDNIHTVTDGNEEFQTVTLHQQKTGRYVEIPCNSKLKAIFQKYPEGMPKLSDEKINLYIKEIGRMANIDEKIEIKENRGGKVIKTIYPKYLLIGTHTARRTGATLMYLDGMHIYDIMKITGHRSVATLEKYIRADKLEVAQKLVRNNYQYFK